MIVNPYAFIPKTESKSNYFGDFATRLGAGFLFRQIELTAPAPMTLTYNGWWFRQRILVDQEVVFQCISWTKIRKRLEFEFTAPAGLLHQGSIEIDFSKGLRIQRFRIWIDDFIVYDEVV